MVVSHWFEILIVVVILGILAATIPQFTQASTEARESSR